MRNTKIKYKIDNIKKFEKKNSKRIRKDLINKANKFKYDFHQYETIRSFGESIYTGKINIDIAEIDQTNLLENMVNFNNKSGLKNKEGKAKKTFDSESALCKGRELTLNANIYNISNKRKNVKFKVLTFIQKLQRLLIILAQVKEGDTSENLLNEIRQFIYSL